jgi:hypothetical protein
MIHDIASVLSTPPAITGMIVGSRLGDEVTLYRNGAILGGPTAIALGALPSQHLYLHAFNNAGTALNFDDGEYTFFSIGRGLTLSQAADLYAAVQAAQTTLSRNL